MAVARRVLVAGAQDDAVHAGGPQPRRVELELHRQQHEARPPARLRAARPRRRSRPRSSSRSACRPARGPACPAPWRRRRRAPRGSLGATSRTSPPTSCRPPSGRVAARAHEEPEGRRRPSRRGRTSPRGSPTSRAGTRWPAAAPSRPPARTPRPSAVRAQRREAQSREREERTERPAGEDHGTSKENVFFASSPGARLDVEPHRARPEARAEADLDRRVGAVQVHQVISTS